VLDYDQFLIVDWSKTMPITYKKKQLISDAEALARKQTSHYVLTSSKLEGVDFDNLTLEDFAAYNRGEINATECFQKGINRLITLQHVLSTSGKARQI
jgi:hypothetical protein